MKTIWYIEDNEDIARYVIEYLQESGYETKLFSNGVTLRNDLAIHAPDLLLLDWNLPDDEAPSICRWVRNFGNTIPIIIVTVRDDPKDIVYGLESGADDYVSKPFVIEVLLSRIAALLRRTNSDTTTYRCGNLLLEDDSHKVFLGDKLLELTPNEYKLLLLFMRNKGRLISRAAIQDSICDMNGDYLTDNAVTVAIKRLREKLGSANSIVTVRNFGYRMEEPQ